MAIVRVSEKGQVTLPIELRRRLGIHKNDVLAVEVDGDQLKLRKLSEIQPLSSEDPIWTLIGQGSSGTHDVSERHDQYLAEGERKRWRKS